MRQLLVLASMVLFASSASAQQPGVMGTWLTESGVAQVRIEPCADPRNGPLCGFSAVSPDFNAPARHLS